jgi:hypothetical protein
MEPAPITPSPFPQPGNQSLTDDRREDPRRSFFGKLRMRVDSLHLEGQAENVSATGILFFTDRPLRVTVEIEDNGVLKSRPGRLVRAQRVNGDSTGWAVEFDEEE